MYDDYIRCIKTNMETSPEKWTFKSDPSYTTVLEHVNIDQASQYLNLIQTEFSKFYIDNLPLLKKICSMNDSYGKPSKANVGIFTDVSPSNFRYMYQSLLILTHANNKGLKTIDFIEIGGGYGGLILFIHNLASLFKVTVKSYTLFDLNDALKLQNKYLALHGID